MVGKNSARSRGHAYLTATKKKKRKKEPAKLTYRPQTLAPTDHHTIKRQKRSQTPILRLPMVPLTLNQYK